MMKVKKLLGILAFLMMAVPVLADDDVLITRDGSMIPVKIEKISTSQVTFVDLKHKKRGRLNAPADFVYMIMREKGNNVFFDEEGNQTTSPVVKFDKKDNVLFLNRGEMFVVYEISVGKEDITYKLKDKKKAPIYKIGKSDVFMLRNSDGTVTLVNDSYQERQRAAKSQASQPSVPQVPANAQQAPANAPQAPANAHQPQSTVATQNNTLLASGSVTPGFYPAPGMNPADLEMAVNAKMPYTLFRKGSVAEYCFQYKGKQTQYRGGPTYVQQIVYDEKIENGLLVAQIQQALYNKKHEPSKGVVSSFKESIFPTEIDTAGTYHLTHNIIQDFMIISKRRGFGLLIPSNLTPGMQLESSTIYDNAKNGIGGIIKVETAYSGWKVEAAEQISTPAGTFDCMKLTGRLSQRVGSASKFIAEKITCWVARGVGIVQYETVGETDKSGEPFVMYLNKLDLK